MMSFYLEVMGEQSVQGLGCKMQGNPTCMSLNNGLSLASMDLLHGFHRHSHTHIEVRAEVQLKFATKTLNEAMLHAHA